MWSGLRSATRAHALSRKSRFLTVLMASVVGMQVPREVTLSETQVSLGSKCTSLTLLPKRCDCPTGEAKTEARSLEMTERTLPTGLGGAPSAAGFGASSQMQSL